MCVEKNGMFTYGNCPPVFSYNDFNDHRQKLSKQLEEREVTYDIIQQIQTSKETRQLLFKDTIGHISNIEIDRNKFINQLPQSRQENDCMKLNLSQSNKQLTEPIEELAKPSNITIQQDSIPSVYNIYVTFSFSQLVVPFTATQYAPWRQNGITITGGNGQGNRLNQLCFLQHIYVDDDDQTIYIDSMNDCIMDWKSNANNGPIVAGGNGQGNLPEQLSITTDVIIDIKNDSLIICDNGNKQEVLWFCPDDTIRPINIPCRDYWGLTMDNNRYLYVSDTGKYEDEATEYRQYEKFLFFIICV